MLKVKSFLQTDGYCGPFCLKSIFEYYGLKVDVKDIARIAKTSVKNGTSPQNMVMAARKYGFSAEYKENCKIDQIKYLIKNKFPVIVSWFSGYDSHYSITIGIDNSKIFFIDPEFDEIKSLPLKVFDRLWFDYNSKKEFKTRPLIIIKP